VGFYLNQLREDVNHVVVYSSDSDHNPIALRYLSFPRSSYIPETYIWIRDDWKKLCDIYGKSPNRERVPSPVLGLDMRQVHNFFPDVR